MVDAGGNNSPRKVLRTNDQSTPFDFGGGVERSPAIPNRDRPPTSTRSQHADSDRNIVSGSRQYTALVTQHPQQGRWSPQSDFGAVPWLFTGSTVLDTLARQQDGTCSTTDTRQQLVFASCTSPPRQVPIRGRPVCTKNRRMSSQRNMLSLYTGEVRWARGSFTRTLSIPPSETAAPGATGEDFESPV